MWYQHLDDYLFAIGFNRCDVDSNVYVKTITTNFVIITIYVDSTIVINNNLTFITNTKTKMATMFEMSLLGDICFLLDI
jgi:hypothetical protein